MDSFTEYDVLKQAIILGLLVLNEPRDMLKWYEEDSHVSCKQSVCPVAVKSYFHNKIEDIRNMENNKLDLEDILYELYWGPLETLSTGQSIFKQSPRQRLNSARKRLLIIEITQTELRSFCNIFELYANYMKSNKDTFIPRIVGIFRLSTRSLPEIHRYYILSQACYPTSYADMQYAILMDGNSSFVVSPSKPLRNRPVTERDILPLPPLTKHTRTKLMKQLTSDLQLFTQLDMVNYSFAIVAVDRDMVMGSLFKPGAVFGKEIAAEKLVPLSRRKTVSARHDLVSDHEAVLSAGLQSVCFTAEPDSPREYYVCFVDMMEYSPRLMAFVGHMQSRAYADKVLQRVKTILESNIEA